MADEAMVYEYWIDCPEHGRRGPFPSSAYNCPECQELYCGFYELDENGELVKVSEKRSEEDRG